MTVFLSYAHQDVELAAALRQDLEDIGQSVWLDESLHGGQLWWDEILRQLGECHLFILAVSLHSLASEACVAEWEYAAALNRPFLPVRLDNTDWTTAPAAMRESQHIDFQVGNVQSTKSLARALMSVPDSIPLPDVLPPPPPAPQSYRERFATLFGPGSLTIEEQVNYYVRLSLDIDSANSDEALALLRVLHARPDLSWKVRDDIDKLIGEPPGAGTQPNPPGVGDAVTKPAEIDDGGIEAGPRHRSKRLTWGLAIVVAAVVVVGVVLLLGRDSDSDAVPPQPENSSCSIDTCSETPIRFIDLAGDEGEIEVTLTDPFSNEVDDVDPPAPRSDGSLEWVWSADYHDPLGTYTVQFSSPSSETIEYNFTVESGSGPFGVVQRLAEAISAGDWETAAAIDGRIRDELDQEGVEFLELKYPPSAEKHWVPNDASGQPNALSTTIIGAFIIYLEDENETFAYCEVWAVDPGEETMRSGKLPVLGDGQERASLSGRVPPSTFNEWIADRCVAAAEPESS